MALALAAAGLRWLAAAARQAAPAMAHLAPTCRQAALHATLACMGAAPQYYLPGWGPCSHCWGWLCVGAVLGGLLVSLLWLQQALRRATPPAWTTAAEEILHCVATGGEHEFLALADAAGQTPAELPCRVLHAAASPHAPSLPAPPPMQPAPPKGHARRHRKPMAESSTRGSCP